jgi:tRNA threonylcarbamoyladenosine biosynthesis protein TsaB
MTLLGFDTATAATAACVLRADGEAFEVVPPVAALTAPPGHARELMPAVATVMKRAGVGFAELEAVAVGVGPGTFTGLRIGVATARGLALAHGLELRPVSSLAALAQGIGGADAPALGAIGGEEAAADARFVLPCIDAKRGELFAALYEDGAERWAPFAATPEVVAERVRAAGLAPRAAGDGSVRFREVLEAAGVRVESDESPLHVIRALNVCRLGAEVAGVASETVLPEYIRVPDAKPA